MQQEHERLEQVDSPPETREQKEFHPFTNPENTESTELGYHLQTVIQLQASGFSACSRLTACLVSLALSHPYPGVIFPTWQLL